MQTRALLNNQVVLPWQVSILRSKASVRVILGGYGSGKTTGAALAMCVHALSTPWREEYGDTHPESLVIGKTDKVIKDSSMRAVKQVLPAGMIRKEWKSTGERAILLCNGHMIKFRTWSGSIEGLSVTSAWLDEAHLLDDSQAFTNYIARMRDPLVKKKLFLVSGIPEFGWIQEVFGPGSEYPDSEVFHISTYDNTYLHPDDIARIRASCTKKSAETYLMGRWCAPDGAIFFEFEPNRHFINDFGDRGQPVDIGIDVGNQGAVVFLQQRDEYFDASGKLVKGKRLHVVDEILPDDQSIGQTIRQAKQRGWSIKPGRSLIFVDPTTDRDERAAIERELPGVGIIKKARADESRNVEYGIRCINAAFADADGNCRLTLSNKLQKSGRGLRVSLPSFRRSETTGKPVKDNKVDHVLDALRYPVAHHLPLKGRIV